ncbi:alpha/beta fold hydrolase [Candidatus Saccharibacteria bacterium]|nr:alpha/beta fold hydrolase [Candidatus Saccharibacteria bacterium]
MKKFFRQVFGKPILAAVMALVMTLSLCCALVTGPTLAAPTTATTVRYTVLCLDVSGSMSGTPMEQMKAAAKNFITQMFASRGKNYIALCSYSDGAVVNIAFSEDKVAINEAIDKISAHRMTNTHAGLQLSEQQFKLGNLPQDVIKNIVLLSDGLPSEGERLEIGRYDVDDYDYYDYANAVYTLAESLWANYNIYTLGFFHDLDGEYLDFARRFMDDLQNKGYYDVTDGDKLEFTFGEVVDDITKGNENYPIILIPGIMGSRLFKEGSTKFDNTTSEWLPGSFVLEIFDFLENDLPEHYIKDTSLATIFKEGTWVVGEFAKKITEVLTSVIPGLNKALSGSLSVRPPEPQNLLSSFGRMGETEREYGTADSYKEIVDRLCEEFTDKAKGTVIRKVYVFSYDWRKDIAESADKLAEFINSLSVGRVDLIGHSMGGLVASKYYAQYGGGKVNKIITAGTPYEGAPKLLSLTLHDVLQAAFKSGSDIFDFIFDIVASLLDRDVKTGFCSVAELAPTENYFEEQPMQEMNFANIGDHEMQYSDYINKLKELYPAANVDTAKLFHEGIHGKSGGKLLDYCDLNDYNTLLDYPNAYFSIGTGQKTIAAVTFNRHGIFSPIRQLIYEEDLEYTGKGDGTVPYLSASICGLVPLLDKGKRWHFFETKHGGTVEGDSLDWIVSILKDETTNLPSSIPTPGNYQVIRVACPVDVKIQRGDEALEYSLANGTYFSRSAFGRMDIIGADNDIKMACMDDNDDYKIILTGTGTGTMDYELRFFDGNDNLLYTYSAMGVPIAPTTVIVTGTNTLQTMVLSVDENGDGNVDRVIPLTRRTAGDNTPPANESPDNLPSNSGNPPGNNPSTPPDNNASNMPGNTPASMSPQVQTTISPFLIAQPNAALPKTGRDGMSNPVLFCSSLLVFCVSMCWLLCYKRAKRKLK